MAHWFRLLSARGTRRTDTAVDTRCSQASLTRCSPTISGAVGGNHEAVNHLWELYYGGWAAPNIYYLGHAGVVNFGGLRIAGLSGIWNAPHYSSGHFETAPYDRSTVRSAYHVRDLEVYRLLKVLPLVGGRSMRNVGTSLIFSA
jgi:hypothetical protein